MIWPRVLISLGIASYGMWYLDSYAVLATLDAVRAGNSPDAPNPLDPLFRNHVYSDWWFALGRLGLGRQHNFLVGTSWVAAFAVTVWTTARPRNFRETAWLAALMLSPPILLGVHRANNDLVIFVLLAICGVAAAGVTWGRRILALAALALATGLKFYPAPAALAFLWARPLRRMPVMLLLALAVAALTLASVWSQVSRGQFDFASTLHATGAPILWHDLGLTSPGFVLLGVGLITLAAIGLVGGRCTMGLATLGSGPERLLAAMGGIVVLACFVAGASYAYRWVFALWLALWLWRQAWSPVGTRRQVLTVRLGCGLLFLCFWLDGVLCFVVNEVLPPADPTRFESLQHVWRLCTQPLQWLMMMLLAGWLLEAALVIGREWLADRR
ncbi:MAG: hypothetical protein JWQ62_2542 [Lacunisphaera sp.]|nr:hypothetical protein [Lacunisphaera sp.]